MSDRGRVYSSWSRRPLRASRTKHGYLAVCLYAGGRRKTLYLHRLVALAFLGPPPDGFHDRGSALDVDASSPTIHPEMTNDDDDPNGDRFSGNF